MHAYLRRLLASAAALALTLTALLTASMPAQAAVPDVWAFAYNDTLAPAPGSTMNTAYQWGTFKTACPLSWATITMVTPGKYAVVLPCSSGADSRGVVHVTAVNDNGRYCEIENWADSGTSKVVTVLCFKGPSPDPSKFTVSYMRSSGPAGAGAHAYVHSDFAGSIIDAYNSASGAVTVTHIGTGRYEARFAGLSGGLATYNGDWQATAQHVNDLPRRCKIDNWFYSGPDYSVLVSCTNPNGALTDTWWTLSYHHKRAVTGVLPGSNRFAYETTLAGAPAGSNYNPIAPPNTFVAVPPGKYTMMYPGVWGGRTHMQVTALAGTYGHWCNLESVWTPFAPSGVQAKVICFSNVGTLADNMAFTTYTSNA
ncbi:hypothetical protein [Longispora albida]|uniref:hypothetical protein n=1 Tax=Longispora albida TaxID=203523 RepID=UPI00037CE4D9|nr:hypothetical protein [Longispora albida]